MEMAILVYRLFHSFQVGLGKEIKGPEQFSDAQCAVIAHCSLTDKKDDQPLTDFWPDPAICEVLCVN